MVKGIEELRAELNARILPRELEVFEKRQVDVLYTIRPHSIGGGVASKLIDRRLLKASRIEPLVEKSVGENR